MKKRDKQRDNRRKKEEMVSLKDSCGIYDPTPHEALKRIVRGFHKEENDFLTNSGFP
jgi:hypothetical protein